MQNTNKILCNLDQQLTDDEKAQARNNIKACTIASQFMLSGTHTITSSEASNGTFEIEHILTDSQKGQIWLESIGLVTTQSLNDSVVPMTLNHKYTYAGGGENIDSPKTGIFAKIKNTAYFGVDMNNDMSFVTAVSYVFNFDTYKISEGVTINYEIDISVLD